MSGLEALQREFQAYLLGRPNAMAARVVATPRADAELLLGVYGDAYALRLIEALSTDYPALARLAGEERFETLARAYIAVHPSRHPSVRWFGRHLPDFLRAASPWSDEPALAEMAAFEWALGEAFDAADAVPIGFDAVVAMLRPEAWPTARFRALPSLRRLDLVWNAPEVWRAVDQQAVDLPALRRSEEPVSWAIWRPRLTTEYRSLAADEAWALDLLHSGGDFAALCGGLLRWHDAADAAGRAAGLLRLWIEQEMIADVIS